VSNKRGRQITNWGGLFDPFAIGAAYRIRPGTRDLRFAARRASHNGERAPVKAHLRASYDGERAQLKAARRGRHTAEG